MHSLYLTISWKSECQVQKDQTQAPSENRQHAVVTSQRIETFKSLENKTKQKTQISLRIINKENKCRIQKEEYQKQREGSSGGKMA